MIEWHEFESAVKAAGLLPRKCLPAVGDTSAHWQIRLGNKQVYCWPNTKHGFRYQPAGENVQSGSVADAIKAAAGVKERAPWPEEVEDTLQAIRDADPPVGLCRRLWRWFW